MKYYIYLFLVFISFNQNLYGQESKLDSLLNFLESHSKSDTLQVDLNIKIAQIYLSAKDNKTIIYGKKALRLSKQIHFTNGTVKSLWILGSFYMYSDTGRTMDYYRQALEASTITSNNELTAKSLNTIGIFYRKHQNYKKAKEYFQKSLIISKKNHYQHITISNLNNQGIISKRQSDFKKAVMYYNQALKTARETNNNKKECEILNNIGLVYKNTGDYPKALEYELQALAVSENIHYEKVSASCMNNIGIIYQTQKKYDKALEYYKKALKIANKLNYYRLIASLYNNEGIIYLYQKKFHKAKKSFFHSLIINSKTKNKTGIASNLKNIGTINQYLGEYKESVEFFSKALTIDKEYGNIKGICLSLEGLGNNYLLLKNYDKALVYLTRSLEIADSIGLLSEQANTHELLASIYKNKKDYKKAYTHFAAYKEINDSLFNINSSTKIAELENNYKYNKEKEILKQQEFRKNALLKEKAKRNNLIKTGLTAGVIVLIFIIILLVSLFLNKYKANKALNFKNQEILNQKNQISSQKDKLQIQAKSLMNSQEHLEEKVIKKTADLIVAKEKAEESERLKTAFLNNISHEFRTPMNGILGFSNLITEKNLSQEIRLNYAHHINKSCTQLLHIVDDTIAISKVHSGLIKMEYSNIKITELIKELIGEQQESIKEKGIDFQTVMKLKEGAELIRADYKKLRTILWHLITNAIKFTFNGSIILTVIQADNTIFFEIKDTGIGIPLEMQKIIFNPFRQADIELSKNHGGTGVGLSLTKAYVELMGGSINLDSGLGKGTTISVTIPYLVENIESKKAIKKTTDNLSNKTVLVAEDDEINFYLIKEILSHYNTRVIHAWNGKEAITKFKENPKIDLIIMDIKMPLMNGYDATKIIKSLHPNITIIAHSAHISNISDAEMNFDIFDGIVDKPINITEFISTLKGAL